jgi:hypothetical protein
MFGLPVLAGLKIGSLRFVASSTGLSIFVKSIV